jgi:hypothetical protein
VYLPPDGVTSGCRTKWSAVSLDFRSVDQTWTVPVDRPPLTVTDTVFVVVASLVSTIVL